MIKNRFGFWILGFIWILTLGFGVYSLSGCSSIKTFLAGSDTNLKSTSLSTAASLRAMGVTIAGTSDGTSWLITPNKISGKVMSVVIPSNGAEDEGIVPFGKGRPDIAPANSDLYDFDLSTVTKLHSDALSIKPGFKGGSAEAIILLFGYFDVVFSQEATEKKIRFVYGDTTPYVRGDKLMYNASGETTSNYYWYNTSTESFVAETGTRPTYPSINSFVAGFSDPIRPNMHYYMLGAKLRNCRDYDGRTGLGYITLSKGVLEDNSSSFTVDFDVQNAVKFSNVTTEAEFNALTDAELIQKFDMVQNTQQGWSDTGLWCSISYEATPKFK